MSYRGWDVGGAVVRNSRFVAWAVCGITLAAAFLIPRFRVDPNVSSMLPSGHEAVELLEATTLGEQSSRTLFVVVSGDELAEELPDFVTRLRESDFLESVDATAAEWAGDVVQAARRAPLYQLEDASLVELERVLAGSGRSEAIEEAKALLAEDALAGEETVLADPLGLRWILASGASSRLPAAFAGDSEYLILAGGRSAVLRLLGKGDPFDVDFSRDLLADVERRAKSLRLEFVGGYATARSDSKRIKGDLTASLVWSIPLLLFFLVASSRSVVLAHLYLLPVAIAVVWAIGFGGALLGPLTPLALSSAAILMGLGVDFALHYVTRFVAERESGNWAAAVQRTHAGVVRALVGGMVTTTVAFLCFGMGSFQGLRSFGFLLAGGLVAALFTTLTLLPLALRPWKRLPRSAPSPILRGCESLLASSAGRPVAVVVAGVALAGWAAVAIVGLRFDADPSYMRPADESLLAAARSMEEELGFSPLPIGVLVPAEWSVDRIGAAVEGLGDRVPYSTGIHTLVPTSERVTRVQQFRERTSGWVAETLEAFSDAGFRADALRPALDAQRELFEGEPAESSPGLASEMFEWRGDTFHGIGLYPREALGEASVRSEFRAAITVAFGDQAKVVDPYSLADALGPLLEADVRRAVMIATALIALLAMISVGGVRAGCLALLPALIGLGVTLGVLVLIGTPIHPGNFVALPLVLGIGVDDGIHMVLQAGSGPARPTSSAGVAIWRTTVTTAIGFGSLASAASPAIASLGTIALVGVVASFVATVLVLPHLHRECAA